MTRTQVAAAAVLAACAAVVWRAPRSNLGGAQPQQCSAIAPRALVDAEGFAAYVEAPQIVRAPDGIFVLGSPAIATTPAGGVYVPPGAGDSPLLAGARIMRDGAIRLLVSPVPGRLASPRAVLDPGGRVSLLWMDADSISAPLPDRPIKWARWLDTHWTKPAALEGTENLGVWRENYVSPPARVGSTVMMMATFGVPARDRHRRIIWKDNGWTAQPLINHDDVYTSLIAVADTLLVASVDYGPPDGNAVFVTRSLDAGLTYAPRTRVSPPGSGAAQDPRLLQLPSGRLVLVWIAGPGFMQEVMLAAHSDDNGRNWRMSPPLRPAGAIGSMRASTTHSGKVVAILQVGGSRQQIPNYVEWTDGRWSAPLPLIADSATTFGAPGIEGGETVVAAWAYYRPNDRRPMTRFIVLPGDCQAPRSPG